MGHSTDARRVAGLAPASSLLIFIGIALPFSSSAATDHSAAVAAANDYPARWADEMTAPRNYIGVARRAVDRHHYATAARNLRSAAAMVAQQEGYAIGRERARLHIAAQALRLTAKDVAAGAASSAAQLDAVLNDTHRDLLARHPLHQ